MTSKLSWIWEAPLGCVSRFLFVITRGILRRIANLKLRRDGQSSQWQLLSAGLIERRFALPVIMTEGPRWNTHAIIGRVGPIDVRQSLDVQVPTAKASARHWTIVVYTFPEHSTVRVLGPGDLRENDDGWFHLNLAAGAYSLILRYYDPMPASALPAVRADNEARVESEIVPPENNWFYERLYLRRNRFYELLHFHAYAALRHRAWLPLSLVRKIYLPVGNPETTFRYGALGSGETLRVNLTEGLLNSHDVYITFYDIASFPLQWQRLTDLSYHWERFGRRCTYLIRLHRHSTTASEPTTEDVLICTESDPVTSFVG